MPNFLETILAQLKRADGRVVLREVHGDRFVSVTGKELVDQIQLVRAFLRSSGIHSGDRCALLAPNSIRWAAFHLALMAEGVIVVPLYARQAPAELAAMMKDCHPRLVFTSDAALGESVAQAWPDAPRRVLFDEVLQQSLPQPPIANAPNPCQDSDIVTIIYTSGTSGEPKGVCLNVGAPRSAHGRDPRTGSRLPLLAVQFCGLHDLDALLSCARKRSYTFNRSQQARRRNPLGFTELFSECPHFVGARPARSRRRHCQAAGDDPFLVCKSAHRLGAAARGAWPRARCAVAGSRPRADLSQDSRALRHAPARADLRLRAARSRNAAIFPHARHSRAPGLWAYGNHRDLHAG